MIGLALAALGGVAALGGLILLRAAAMQKQALAGVLASTRMAVAEAKEDDRVHLQGRIVVGDAPVTTPLQEPALLSRIVVQAYERDALSAQNEERGAWQVVYALQQSAARCQLEDDTGRISVDVEEARFLVGPDQARTWSTAPGGTPPPSSVIAWLEEKKAPVYSKRTGGLRTMKIVLERLLERDVVDVYGVIKEGAVSAHGVVPLVVATSATLAAKRADAPAQAARKLGSSLLLGGGAGLLAGALLTLLT